MYFGHHVLLWQDPAVELTPLPLKGGWNRMLAGMPLMMLQAAGPGHIAFSRDAPGELLAVPLQAGGTVDVRENHFLVATSQIGYDWLRVRRVVHDRRQRWSRGTAPPRRLLEDRDWTSPTFEHGGRRQRQP